MTSINSVAATLLIVEDDDVLRSRLAMAFERRGFEVAMARDYDEAVSHASSEPPEYALVDMKLPGRSGLEVVKVLNAFDPATCIVVMTGYGTIASALDAVRLGATHYLAKPADVDDILLAFERKDASSERSIPPTVTAPSIARAEREHIERILGDCDGNISEAARVLKVPRKSLQRKIRKVHPGQ